MIAVASYEELLAACRNQVQALGINYAILDSLAGFTDGYTAKLLGHSEYCSTGGRRTKRHFSPVSFDAYLAALGFDLVLVENPAKVARLKTIMENKMLAREGPIYGAASNLLVTIKLSRDFLKKIGRAGGVRNAELRAARAAQKRALQKRNRRAALSISAPQRKANARAAALKRWRLTKKRGGETIPAANL